MAKGGRPRKTGERYPSGELLKHKAEGIAPALWARIRANAIKEGGDARLATELGRLSFHGEITNAQAAAGFRVAEIYRRYHRAKRLRTTAKTANLEQGFGGSADLAEERMSTEQLEAYESSIKAAEADWLRLQEEMPLWLREIPDALVELCVNDRPLNPTMLPAIRVMLDNLARVFGEQWRRQGKTSKGVRPMARSAPKIAAIDVRPLAPTAGDPNVKAIEAIAHALKLDDAGVAKVRDTFIALVARERFRRRAVVTRSSA